VGKILDKLADERVLKITPLNPPGSSWLVEEACDNYFFVDLTKEEMLELAEEIKALANGY
jgi:hypothetical protein